MLGSSDAPQTIESPLAPQTTESPLAPQTIEWPLAPQTIEYARAILFALNALMPPPPMKSPEALCPSPAIEVSGELDGSSVNSTAARTLVEPAPAPINPAVGMNVLVVSRTTRTSAGFRCDRRSSTSATSPLTTPADMLVPDNCITAFAPV